MILLDSTIIIGIINKRPAPLRERFLEQVDRRETILVSTIVVFELRFGAAKSGKPAFNTQLLDEFLAGQVEVVAFEAADAARAGSVRAELQAKGTPIGPYDTLIAGQVLRLGATLVTANTREFSRVAGLSVEDWTA